MPRRPDSHGPVEVRAFEASDEPAVLEVLEAAFGQWPHSIQGTTPSEFFHWKHVDGPFGASSVLVAESDGVVVGVLAYMRWRFRAGGRTLETMRGVDLALHPERRRRGASSALAEAAVRHFPRDLAFVWGNPNARGTPVSVRSGWHEVAPLARSVQPRAGLLATIGRTLARGPQANREMSVDAAGVAELLSDDASVAPLLARMRDSDDRLTTAKDLDYLRWRYGRFNEYRALRSEGGEGIAIFRPRRHGRYDVLDICELLAERGDRLTMRRLLHQVAAPARVDFLSCTFPTRREAALWGFVQARHHEVLVTYPMHPQLIPDSTQRSSWALSGGDLELL